MSPFGRGAILGLSVVAGLTLVFWMPMANLAERPSPQLLRYMAGAGAAGIAVALGLAERAEVQHWTWLDGLIFAFAVSSLIFLALSVVLSPLLTYERLRKEAEGSADEENEDEAD